MCQDGGGQIVPYGPMRLDLRRAVLQVKVPVRILWIISDTHIPRSTVVQTPGDDVKQLGPYSATLKQRQYVERLQFSVGTVPSGVVISSERSRNVIDFGDERETVTKRHLGGASVGEIVAPPSSPERNVPVVIADKMWE